MGGSLKRLKSKPALGFVLAKNKTRGDLMSTLLCGVYTKQVLIMKMVDCTVEHERCGELYGVLN